MSKFLFILMLCPMIVCSQPLKTTDSTTVSTPALKRILVAAEQKKVLESQVNILNQRILNYQLIIKTLNEKDSATVVGYQDEIRTMRDEIQVYEVALKDVQKQLKKEKRKRKWTAFGGIAMTAGFTYLYLTK